MSDLIEEQVDGGVGVITINRPEKRNAMTGAMLEALPGAVFRMRDDPAVRCVVLTGAGTAFSVGGDVESVFDEARADAGLHPALRKRPQTANAKVERLIRVQEAAIQLHVMPKPTIAMINGACAGAAFALAGACDLRLAAKSAVFSTGFVKLSVSSDYGGAYFWTRIAGAARARELYLLSEKFDAATALAQGLVTRVYPDADLRDETMSLAAQIASRAPHAYGLLKRSLNLAESGSLEDTLRIDAIGMVLSGYENLERSRLAKDAERFADQIAARDGEAK